MSEGIDNPGYLAFVDALLDGRLKLGQTLTQDELCAVLDISLSPMRESTTLLEAEGLVTVRKRVGITIFYPDVKFVGNTYQFRGILEREGLTKFIRTMDAGWVERWRAEHLALIEHVRDVDDQLVYREPVKLLEHSFHACFVAACDNRQISIIYQRLIQKMFLIRLINLEAVGTANTIRSLTEHLGIIDALEAHDVDRAVAALDQHLQGALHRVLTA